MIRTLALLALLQPQDTRPEELPAIRPVAGDLKVWRAATGGIDAVKQEVRVAPADRIGTAGGEYACLLITEGEGLVSLKGIKAGKDRGLGLERAKGGLVLKVYDGKVTLETFATEIVVQTPQGEVRGKQAYFYIEVAEDKTKVVSIEGTVTFANDLGGVDVGPGEEATAAAGKKPSEPRKSDPRALREIFDAPQNRLANPGFETEAKGWDLPTDNRFWSFDRELVHTGARSACFEVTPKHFAGRRDGGLACQRGIAVTQGRRYIVRAYVYLRTVKGSVSATLSFMPLEEGGDRDGLWTKTPLRENAWTMLRLVGTAKRPTMDVSISFQIRSDDYEARIWADDVALIELPR